MRKFSKLNENTEHSEHHYIDKQEVIDVFQDLLDCDYGITSGNYYKNKEQTSTKNIFKECFPYTDIEFIKIIPEEKEEYMYNGSLLFKDNSDEIIIFHQCVLRLKNMYPDVKILTYQRDGTSSESNYVELYLRIVYEKVISEKKIDPSEALQIINNFSVPSIYKLKVDLYKTYMLLTIRIKEDIRSSIAKYLATHNRDDNRNDIVQIKKSFLAYCKKHLPDYEPSVSENNVRYDQDIIISVEKKRNFLMNKKESVTVTLYLLEMGLDF